MARVASSVLVRQMESLFGSGSAVGLSDRELLDRFTTTHESDADAEAAFATVVARHGPMVFKVCRQLLQDTHQADDAFQAVFLVLARKARSIQNPDKLSNWLYGVAIRTAQCSRTQIQRRRQCEQGPIMNPTTTLETETSEPLSPAISPEQALLNVEQAELLHAEIARLPQSFRLPILLCYFSGLSLDQAATQLKWPEGTLRSRLARAREKLRRSLIRRGFTLSTTALITILSTKTTSAQLPRLLCHQTARAALQYTTGHAAGGMLSASAVLIAQQVMNATVVQMFKVATCGLLGMGVFATGVAFVSLQTLATKAKPMHSLTLPSQRPELRSGRILAAATPLLAAKPTDQNLQQMIVTARVLTPDGKPTKGALVDLVGRRKGTYVGAALNDDSFELLGRGVTNSEGRVEIEAPRTSSTRFFDVIILAAAPGYGLAWSSVNPDADRPEAELQLRREQLVHARLVDFHGLPAAGIRPVVTYITSGRSKSAADSVSFWPTIPKNLSTWPKPEATDKQGQLLIRGVGPGVEVGLKIQDNRYAQQDLLIKASEPATAITKPVTLALEPAHIIEGRVLANDTGLPISNAIVSVTTRLQTNSLFTAKFSADEQGRFKVNPLVGESYTLGAFPVGGEPYLIPQQQVVIPRATIKLEQNIKLPRGVLIRGKLTEARTGRPLSGGSIQYIPIRGRDEILAGWQAIVHSGDDGTFRIAVSPGRGHLLVFGPTSEFVLEEIGSNQLFNGRPGGTRYRAHKIIPYDAKVGDSSLSINAKLQPALTIKGRVEGPNGEPVTKALILTTLCIEAFNPFWRGDYQVNVRDGRFQLNGLASDATTRVSILDPEHEWGATVELSSKQANDEVLIRLDRCGQARATFVNLDRKPIPNNYWPMLEFIATDGPNQYSRLPGDQSKLFADTENVSNVDRKHYGNFPKTSANGQITFPALIPGAQYRITDFSNVNDAVKGVQIRKDFTVKSGETVDLGDILIEKPDGR